MTPAMVLAVIRLMGKGVYPVIDLVPFHSFQQRPLNLRTQCHWINLSILLKALDQQHPMYPITPMAASQPYNMCVQEDEVPGCSIYYGSGAASTANVIPAHGIDTAAGTLQKTVL